MGRSGPGRFGSRTEPPGAKYPGARPISVSSKVIIEGIGFVCAALMRVRFFLTVIPRDIASSVESKLQIPITSFSFSFLVIIGFESE